MLVTTDRIGPRFRNEASLSSASTTMNSPDPRREWAPAEFSRPEVLAILRDYYAGLEAHEKVEVKLAGHSAR